MKRLPLLMLFVFLVAMIPSIAAANRTHRVQPGQTLVLIARRFDVPVSSLAGANSMAVGDHLRAGQVLTIPDPGEAYVARGQTLSHVARAHGVSIADLRRANNLREDSVIIAGQRLVLPGTRFEATEADLDETPQATSSYGRPASPGRATILRGNERRVITLVDRRGRARAPAIQQLARLMAYRDTNRTRRPLGRLVELLARISDHFGGRPIMLVSGYRDAGGYTRESSRHVQGHALDFSIHGVPNSELRDFCRTFDQVGVGYYPNSSFVHLDVRERSTYWVDYSGPGERPRYQRASDASPTDATEEAETPTHEPEADDPSVAETTPAPVEQAE